MGVLAMIEIDGDPRLIAAAIAELERLLPPAPGLLARIVAPTDDGMILVQLWESPAARQANADDPDHRDALRASGMIDAMTATRSRVFDAAQLTLPSL
ncbi:MAG TPA: hypothetical protein VNT54_11350 [Solirubrobacteraceae bacterium]|nr:hypothetical protein [Solirubrobacteraceae bacterium]